ADLSAKAPAIAPKIPALTRIPEIRMEILAHCNTDAAARRDINAFAGHFSEKVDLLRGNHIRRQEIHHAAQRTQQRATLQCMLEYLHATPLLPRVSSFGGLVLNHLDRNGHAGLTHFRDMRMIHQVRRCRRHTLRQRLVVLDDVVLLEDIQGRQRSSAGQRVAGIAMRVQKRAQGRVVVIERVVHVVCGHAGRQRQIAAGQRLGQTQEIRANAGLLTGEHGAGTAKANGNFIVDQVHAIAVAGFAQQLEIHRVIHAHAASSLNQGLDDHCRDTGVVLGEGLFHRGKHIPRMLFPAHAFRAVIAVRAWHLDGVQQQRLVGFGKQRHIADRHRRHGFTVVAVGQGDEAFLLWLAAIEPVVKAHLQRNFYARRTVVGVEATRQTFGGELDQPLGQLDYWLMAETGQNHVLQLVDLILDALVDARVGMPEHVHPPRADSIQVALAFKVFEPYAFTTLDRYQRQIFVVFHLGAGVPQDLEVTLHPLVIEAHFQSPGSDSPDARTNNRASLCNARPWNNL
ncbi:hypothetical protein ALP20_05453, partial [Pseudomonas coronafaciens pv. coronafaciens]